MRLIFQLSDPVKLFEGRQTDPTVSVITVSKEYQQLTKSMGWRAYYGKNFRESSTNSYHLVSKFREPTLKGLVAQQVITSNALKRIEKPQPAVKK
jgi:hypothetical protein